MALTYGFYNSVEGDRTYDAIQMGQIFDGIITDGVYATFLKAMVVKASENASEVIVQPGRCWFNHTWTYIDADYPVTAPAPEVILDRVDALVLDINQEYSDRANSIIWVQGTPSSLNPERPSLIKSVTHNQYPLAYVYRKAGTTMIYAADITNAVGTSETPFVTGVLTGINIDDLLAQWDDEFHTWEASTKTSFEAWMVNQQSVYITWFDSIKDQMEVDLTSFEAWFETIRGIIDEEAATHLQAEIDELKDMLPAGSHIDISTAEPTLFNRNVTVSDGVHSKTVQFDSIGGATVESFPYIGIIDVSSTDGERIASESLNIPYFGRYSATLAFWSATVNLVGDESLAGLTVTVRDGNGDVVAVVTLNSSGSGVFTATGPDTYKFIYTYGGQTMEVSLAVTQETTYEVEIHGGFDWRSWLTAGRVSESFSSLDDILKDEPTLRQLMLVHDSVDYICDTFTAGSLTDVTKIFNTDLAAKWINLSDYALDHFYAVSGIKSIMDTADKYGYGEWALMPQVPTMTSNTAPYGTVSISSVFSSSTDYSAWRAFDGNNATYAYPADTDVVGSWLQYQFVNPVCVKRVFVRIADKNRATNKFELKASNDGSTWTSLGEYDPGFREDENKVTAFININNNNHYLYYRVVTVNVVHTSGYQFAGWTALQFYTWAPKGNVPIMTANNAPYGTAFADSAVSDAPQWRAFNPDYNGWQSNLRANAYIGYQSQNPFIIKKAVIKIAYAVAANGVKVQGSNDGSTWNDLGSNEQAQGAETIFTIKCPNNETPYLYHRLLIAKHVAPNDNYMITVRNIQYYGRELKISVPTMTSNTAPYGTAFSNGAVSGYDIYRAFDGNSSTEWRGNGALNDYIGYTFTEPALIKRAYLDIASNLTGATRTCSFKLQGSNNGSTWVDLTNEISANVPIAGQHNPIIAVDLSSNEDFYLRYRVYRTQWSASDIRFCFYTVQFYGLDYSEKEFEVGTTKKWLYDHGVELETFTKNVVGNGSIAEDNGYSLNASVSATAQRSASFLAKVDLTPYNLFRGVIDDQYSGASLVPLLSVYGTATPSYNTTPDAATSNALSTTNRYTAALNISSFNENKYIGSRANNNSESAIKRIKISELWLE